MKEAEEADEEEGEKTSEKRAQKISNWVKLITQKIPQITKLEKKLGMLQGLDPVLEGILKDLNRVTDFSEMIKLQKKQAAAAVSDSEESDDDAKKPVEKLVKKATVSAVKAMDEVKDPEEAVKDLKKIKKNAGAEESEGEDEGDSDDDKTA